MIPQKLFKYLPAQYADSFIERGELLFRILSHFRGIEDDKIRGDRYEGTRIHRPDNGLVITLQPSGQKMVLPHKFESAAQESQIFVLCLSSLLSEDLANEFRADCCIEILDPPKFLAAIRKALTVRPKVRTKRVWHGPIKYYELNDPMGIDWALPEKITFSKLKLYERQQEYRFAFGVKDAFAIHNTHLRLVNGDYDRSPLISDKQEMLIKVGNLTKICRRQNFC